MRASLLYRICVELIKANAMTGADPNPAAPARVRGSGAPAGPDRGEREWTGIREACAG
ncbi:hypothetical protein SAMN06265355_101114 [Actinomadura mexicana]|uniref:Uncharacterized protein n=1 Tax=Actinomadura mexicana TaxID=134959 RepID=A0A238UPJ0_9ACTN|nr:hypothetical protein SAMN06265355_101114 [Actinomadura mexicana]